MFNCKRCGACCESLSRSDIYSHLDNGMGICRYYCKEKRECKIYYDRPLICRIDEAYQVFFKKYYSIEEYYEINYRVCRELSENRKNLLTKTP